MSKSTQPTPLDPVTLDLIENALKNARFEMDEVVRRAAMSPTIREQHDEFPMIADANGTMVVGQFGSYIPEVIKGFHGEINDGDVILLNDPYLCKGSISHCNDWLVIVPILHEDVLVGYSSMFGHMMDVGGRVPGSQVTDALSIWDEGIRIPPVKIVERGVLNEAALRVVLNNTRTPEMNHSDLMALIAGCRTAERRVADLCDRFGRDTYLAACDALLERTRQGMVRLIRRYLPEEKAVFWDWVDDDGVGNGPLKLVLTAWRDGDRAIFGLPISEPVNQSDGTVIQYFERLALHQWVNAGFAREFGHAGIDDFLDRVLGRASGLRGSARQKRDGGEKQCCKPQTVAGQAYIPDHLEEAYHHVHPSFCSLNDAASDSHAIPASRAMAAAVSWKAWTMFLPVSALVRVVGSLKRASAGRCGSFSASATRSILLMMRWQCRPGSAAMKPSASFIMVSAVSGREASQMHRAAAACRT